LRKFLVRFWLFFVFVIGLSWTFFYGIGNWDLLGELPSTQQLENPKFFQASEIYSADGKLIGTYYTENRINVEYKQIPSNLVNA
jgi:penicillin-binding protein 1A